MDAVTIIIILGAVLCATLFFLAICAVMLSSRISDAERKAGRPDDEW